MAVDVDVAEAHLHGIGPARDHDHLGHLGRPDRLVRLEQAGERGLLLVVQTTGPLGGEDVRRQDSARTQVDRALTGFVLREDLVAHGEARGADLGDPALDRHGLEAEGQRRHVGDLVPHDHDALSQVLRTAVRGVRAEHVHPRLLEVVDVGDVVDVPQEIEVGPPQWAVIEMTHASVLRSAISGRSAGDRSRRGWSRGGPCGRCA